MLMGVAHPVVINTLALFYVWNVVAALFVLIFGGFFLVLRLERRTWQWPFNGPPGRDTLIWGLGLLWIIDGLLQAQPLMVTQFVGLVLDPLKSHQIPSVERVVHWGIQLWSLHPLAWDWLAVWVQILIGVGIILGQETRGRRIALVVAVVWALIIWGPGEAFGNIVARGSWLLGSPGSALLYAIGAIVLLFPVSIWTTRRMVRVFELFMAGLWALAALLQAWPGSAWWNPTRLPHFLLSQARMPQPSFVSSPIYVVAHWIDRSGTMANGMLVALFVVLALLWMRGHAGRGAVAVSLGVTILTWWFGQDLGVFGGMSTDPNSGVLLVLALVVYRRFRPPLRGQGSAPSEQEPLRSATP